MNAPSVPHLPARGSFAPVLCLARGILGATFTSSPFAAEVQPSAGRARAGLASALVVYRQAFAAGN